MNRRICNWVTIVMVIVLLGVLQPVGAETTGTFNEERGTWQYQVTSPHQPGPNLVEVLVPEPFDRTRQYRVLYLLPVEGKENHRFGDGMQVLRKLGAQNRYNLIVVAPTFDRDPWYGNHATDPTRRQEEYLTQTVVPLIEREYPTFGTKEGRLLLGYSKSGWGAFSLLLRNPEIFGYAASWDAPLMFTEQQFGIWLTDQNYGTAANMAQYLPSKLLQAHAGALGERTRLVLTGKNLFGMFTDKRFPYEGPSHTEAFHTLAETLKVKHAYNSEITAPHSWNAKWLKPVLNMLMTIVNEEPPK